MARRRVTRRMRTASELRRDEQVVLFTTAAHREPATGDWIVPVHGRIYRPSDGRTARAALSLALKTGFGVAPDSLSRDIYDQRCGLMLSDNRAGRSIVVVAAGIDHPMPPSDRYGQFRGQLHLTARQAEAVRTPTGIPIVVKTTARDERAFEGRVLLIEPEGLSIISDIDDTVKVTHVASRRRMMAMTFLEPFDAVPGMAERFRTWIAEGAALHFISSSPWPLYEPLDRFLADAGFPPSTKTLKNVALKDRSIRNLLAKATRTKPPAIDAILAAFPRRRFVLIGDSVENDAEIYAGVAERHPGRIERILIRDCGGKRERVERARRSISATGAAKLQVFTDASELPASLL